MRRLLTTMDPRTEMRCLHLALVRRVWWFTWVSESLLQTSKLNLRLPMNNINRRAYTHKSVRSSSSSSSSHPQEMAHLIPFRERHLGDINHEYSLELLGDLQIIRRAHGPITQLLEREPRDRTRTYRHLQLPPPYLQLPVRQDRLVRG